jgi:hypothetical protein
VDQPTAYPATDVRFGVTRSSEVLYLTGGLVAHPQAPGTLLIGPVRRHDSIVYVGPNRAADAFKIAAEAGAYFVGSNRVYASGPERCEIWQPHFGSTGDVEQSSDAWAGIAHAASAAGDGAYSDLSRYLSISLRSAALRLREVSQRHHEQLMWSLQAGRKPGSRFSNSAVLELYLAIHSLVAEMCASRDYLAHVCAIHVNAKDGTDSLARLMQWIEGRGSNDALRSPFASLLTAANGTKELPNWLSKLGEMRNRLMHRQPMAADPDASVLLFEVRSTSLCELSTVRLASSRPRADESDLEDPFLSLLRFWIELEVLARSCAANAKYPSQHPVIAVTD